MFNNSQHTLLTPIPTGMSVVTGATSAHKRQPSAITASSSKLPSSDRRVSDCLPPDDIPESSPPAYSLAPDINGVCKTFHYSRPTQSFQRAPEPSVQLIAKVIPVSATTAPTSPSALSASVCSPARPTAASVRQQPPVWEYSSPSNYLWEHSTSCGVGSTAPPASGGYGYPTCTPMPGHHLLRTDGRTFTWRRHGTSATNVCCFTLSFLSHH